MERVKHLAEQYLLSCGYQLVANEQVQNDCINLMGVSGEKLIALKFILEDNILSDQLILNEVYELVKAAKLLNCSNILIVVDSERLLSLTEIDDKYVTPLTMEWMQVK